MERKLNAILIVCGIIIIILVLESMLDHSDLLIDKQEQIMDTDSLARIREKKFIDSLDSRMDPFIKKIKADSIQLLKLRIRNEKLEKLYRSIDLSGRPKL